MTDKPFVPLPDVLNTCTCRFKPSRHLTTCTIAINFDSVPLHERPEYEVGKRFAAISWDFPLRLSANVTADVELDPVAIILKNADEYEAFTMEGGYEPWEKPIVWLTTQIEDELFGAAGLYFGGRRLSRDFVGVDDWDEYPRWTAEDTARLDEALANQKANEEVAIDPNQGTLDGTS